MSDTTPSAPSVDLNPFQSPEVLAVEDDGKQFPNAPSAGVLWSGLVIGSVLNLVTSYTFYQNEALSPLAKILWVIPDLGHGIMYGLGLALLAHALIHRRFSTLMPGHWRLIASASALFGFLLGMPWFLQQEVQLGNASLMVPSMLQQGLSQVLALIFYGVVLVWTQESGIWKAYAWLAAACYLLGFLQFVTVGLMSDGMVGDPSAGFSPIMMGMIAVNLVLSAVSLATFVVLVIGIVLDYQKKIPRDIYHYLGLVLVLVLPLLQGLWSLVMLAIGGFGEMQPFSF